MCDEEMQEGGGTIHNKEDKKWLAEGRVEGYKQTQDSQKHLTTLSAGSIVLIATFLSDIFPKDNGNVVLAPDVKPFVYIAFISFACSILVSTILLIRLPVIVEKIGDIDLSKPMKEYQTMVKEQLKNIYWFRYLAFCAFLGGFVSFIIAVLRSL